MKKFSLVSLLTSAMLSLTAADFIVTAGRLSSAPEIDGVFNPAEWSKAACFGGMTGVTSKAVLADVQPELYLGYDRDALYGAVVLKLPADFVPGGKITAGRHDAGAIYKDDRVELFISPLHGSKDYYYFIVNANSATADGKNASLRWNSSGSNFVSKVQNGLWVIEYSIPFADLGAASPRPGDRWGFNIGMTIRDPEPQTYSWARVNSFHNPRIFAVLGFGDENVPAVRMTDFLRLAAGESVFSVSPATAQLTLRDERKYPVLGAVGGIFDFTLDDGGNAVKERSYDGELKVSYQGKILYQQKLNIARRKKYLIAVNAFPMQRELELEFRGSIRSDSAAEFVCNAVILDAAGKKVAVKKAFSSDRKGGKIVFSSGDIPRGKITLQAQFCDRAGNVLYEYRRDLTDPVDPWWMRDDSAGNGFIPPPYVPVSENAGKIRAALSDYRISPQAMPSNSVTHDQEMLAAPVELKLAVNGKNEKWQGDAPQVVASTPERITLRCNSTSSSFKLHGDVQIEYDGMIRTDLKLVPHQAVKIDTLYLDIPLKKECAKFFYNLDVKWGKLNNVGIIPPDGMRGKFNPYLWLGDDDRGFSWFCESDRNIFPLDKPVVWSVIRDGDAVVLRIHLIENRLVDKELQYTFGFQATPVKKPEKTAWDYRFMHHCAGYGIHVRPGFPNHGMVTYEAAEFFNAPQGMLEFFFRPGKSKNRIRLFTMEFSPVHELMLELDSSSGKIELQERASGKATVILGCFPAKVSSGAFHRLAFGFGDALEIYLDGKLVGTAPRKGLQSSTAVGGLLHLGRVGYNYQGSMEALDEVRISTCKRSQENWESAFGQADGKTLLLDRFDKELKLFGALLSSPEKGAPGRLYGCVESVSGLHGKALLLVNRRSLVEQSHLAGSKTMILHSFWTWMGYPFVPVKNRAPLKKLIDACHKKDMQIIVYSSPLTPDEAGEWELYSKYLLIEPLKWPYRYANGTHMAPACCWNTPYRNLRVKYQDQVMKEYKFDGFYADSSEWPLPCTNTRHGCGYIREDGRLVPTWCIFGTRDYMRRQYAIVKANNPDGQVNIHNSSVMSIPTLHWSTSVMDGEHLDPLVAKGTTRRENEAHGISILPLEKFRIEFTGRQWGVAGELLHKGMAADVKEMLAVSLLHDIMVRPMILTQSEISAIWRLRDRLQLHKARFIPYFEAGKRFFADNKHIKVSGYVNTADGVLLLVANLSADPRPVSVTIDPAALGLGEKIIAVEPMFATGISVSGNRVNFVIPAADYRYIHLKNSK